MLDDPVPHLCIRARSGRELKSANATREIPLVGIALYYFFASSYPFTSFRG